MALDPHSDKYFNYSPFCYAVDNPVLFLDPDGRDVKPLTGIFKFQNGAV